MLLCVVCNWAWALLFMITVKGESTSTTTTSSDDHTTNTAPPPPPPPSSTPVPAAAGDLSTASFPPPPPCPPGQQQQQQQQQSSRSRSPGDEGICCPVCPAGTGATGACTTTITSSSSSTVPLPSPPPAASPTKTTTTPTNTNNITVTATTQANNSNSNSNSDDNQSVQGVAPPRGCEPCVEGLTFSPGPSHEAPCQPCTRTCPKNARVLSACNATQDTVCECEAGLFYLSEKSGQCELCDLCPAGWGARTACDGRRFPGRNTQCHKCQNGTFSDVLSASAPCRPCTVCAAKERVLQGCTATQDTVCDGGKYNNNKVPPIYHLNGHHHNGLHRNDLDLANGGHFNGQAGHGHNLHQATLDHHHLNNNNNNNHRRNDDGVDVIPLYCVALGAVVVGLLGYVVSVHYRRMRVKRLAREPHYEDVEYSKASGADSGIFVDSEHHHHHHQHQHQHHHHQHQHHHHHHPHHQHHHHQHQKHHECAVITAKTRLRDLPQSKKKELEMTFFAGSRGPADWKSLARELGYNSGKIATFEARSLGSRRGDLRAPYRQLLHDWGRLEGATVAAFQRALRSIGRHDVNKFLQAECAEHLQSLTATLPQHVV
ncbi:tumor necrosis factor receptor superfamily member 16-like [Babylonia areolata]|uniref:tumor necrosis factor receptor superfamily member 16-like n=1 Tax=Babylonia areolata TaxID=304850 RepID=UPI003FD322B6